jgi:hypothetical protein
LAAEDSDLVAKYQDLDLFGSISAQHQHQQLEDAPQCQVGKRSEHDR